MWWNWLISLVHVFLTLIAIRIAARFGKTALMTLGVVYAISMNVFVLKLFELFPNFYSDPTHPLSAFYMTVVSILTELYGEREARYFVKLSLGMQVLFSTLAIITIAYKPAPVDFAHPHIVALLSPNLRIVLSSWFAYYVSGVFKASVQARFRVSKGILGKYLWLRDNLTSKVGQLVDNFTFFLLAFVGTEPFKIILMRIGACTLFEFVLDYLDTWVVVSVCRSSKLPSQSAI